MWIYKGKRAEDEMYRAMWERATDDFQGFSGVGDVFFADPGP